MPQKKIASVIVGRVVEQQLLREIILSEDPELLAIYGRRRVGKTYLIREFYGNRILFELTGLHGEPLARQLTNFCDSLRKGFPNFGFVSPSNWLEAFAILRQAVEHANLGNQKRVLFFDEFPWLATRRAGFLPAFEHFWNTFASRRRNVAIVISGSAAAWMIRKVIGARGGLHNRVTRRIRLEPFSLSESTEYFGYRRIQLDDFQTTQLYMAIGGVPHYLNLIQPGKSFAQNIDALCFTKDGLLATEYSNLYAALFENFALHETIVEALANRWQGLTRNEILASTKLASGGGVTSALDELIESGFVHAMAPLYRSVKDTIFRLSDEYSLFYWHWIRKNRSSGSNSWERKAVGRKYQSWCGYAFESLCMKHLLPLKQALGIANVETSEGACRFQPTGLTDEGAQLDLVIDRRDHCINLCEMKFSEAPLVIDKTYAAELERKLRVFRQRTKTKSTLFLTFVTTHGIQSNEYSRKLVASQVTLADLMRPHRIG